MAKRFKPRENNGRFRRSDLERDAGLRVAVCPKCGAFNTYGRKPITPGPFIDPFEMNQWDRPASCSQCGEELPEE